MHACKIITKMVIELISKSVSKYASMKGSTIHASKKKILYARISSLL